jgi:hypothetical protein
LIKPTVYVSGLNNPNRISFDQRGNLYIAEAGTGGNQRTTKHDCPQVAPPLGPVSGGYTGSIARVPPGGGSFRDIVSGLPSGKLSALPPLANVVTGTADVQMVRGRLIGLLGGTGCQHGLINAVNELFAVGRHGSINRLANLSYFALSHPGAHPPTYDLEPEGLFFQFAVVGRDYYVTETNHQFLARVLPNGTVQPVIDFSAIYGTHNFQHYAGPSGLVYHHGFLYIGVQRSYEVPAGSAVVWQFNPRNNQLIVFAKGLTDVMGLTFGRDGTMYVLENSTFPKIPKPGTGKIIAVKGPINGQTQTTIATGLDFPMGITAGPGNALYVANCGFGCRPGQGSILRFQLPPR